MTVEQAISLVLSAIDNEGAFLQLGGVVPGEPTVYGFLEDPNAGNGVEATGTSAADALVELAKRWQERKR